MIRGLHFTVLIRKDLKCARFYLLLTGVSKNVFSRRVSGYHKQEKLFELNLFIRKTIRYTVKQDRLKIIIVLTTSQFAQCPALNETSIGEEFSFCKLEWFV